MIKPIDQDQLADIIALLSVPGIGKGRFRRLVAQFGSPSAALGARLPELESVQGISSALAIAIKKSVDLQAAQDMAARVLKLGWGVLTPDSPEFPVLLRDLPDGPALLFRLGEPMPPDARLVAIVGTRHPSEKGKRFSKSLAAELAQSGVTVVSGMAEGIDSAAHAGAIEGDVLEHGARDLSARHPGRQRDGAISLEGRVDPALSGKAQDDGDQHDG